MDKVTSKYQIGIPRALADQLRIKPGDEIEWRIAGEELRVKPAKSAPPKPIVFISFANADHLMVKEFYARLKAVMGGKVDCFLAQNSIELGKNWPAEIHQHLSDAACVIVVLSDSALSSNWVLFEAGVGHGRGVDVIPIAVAGFKIDRQKPPLSFLQALTISSADQLNVVVDRVAKAVGRKVDKKFTSADLTAIAAKEARPIANLQIKPLLTRRAIFDEAINLVANSHLNSVIRGVSSLVGNKDSRDGHMLRFEEALRARFVEAIGDGGRMRYDVVLGVHRDRTAIPEDAKAAIRRRADLFSSMRAVSRLRMRESADAWSMNLLLVNSDDAILAFPEGSRASRLRYGLRISGSELVAPIVHWYENGLKRQARVLTKGDYR